MLGKSKKWLENISTVLSSRKALFKLLHKFLYVPLPEIGIIENYPIATVEESECFGIIQEN